METWKTIPGYSRYEASNTGKLRSLNYKNSGKVKELKPALCPDGYLKTMILSDEGKYSSWTVHKFITLAFYGKVPKGLEINHKDCDKTNNSIENLEYCTRQENINHACRNGLQKPRRGVLNGHHKISEQDVIDIRNYVNNFKGRYYGRKALAQKYNLCESQIKDIVSGRRGLWNCVPRT